MVSDHLLQTNTIVASILHDIVEDTNVTIGMILDEFGWRIAEMVDRLTRDRPDGTKLSVEEILDNAYEQNDEEILLIKCCDRLHNLDTLQYLSYKKKVKVKEETLVGFPELTLKMDKYQMFEKIALLCIKDNNNPIFQNILIPKLTEIELSAYQFKHIQYYDS